MNNLYTFSEIKNWLFFDIETASEYPSFDILKEKNPAKAKLWSHRCEYLRRRYMENEILTDDQLYQLKAGLHAEFASPVCVAFGIVTYADAAAPAAAQILSYKNAGGDAGETALLASFMKLVGDFEASLDNKGRLKQARMCGHNIKRFDVPFLNKRAMMRNVALPDLMLVHNKKPWDMPFVDTSEIWSFGAWQESFASLDLLANTLGVPSSKVDTDGSQVQAQYWERGDLDGIDGYCRLDVAATINVVLRLSGYQMIGEIK